MNWIKVTDQMPEHGKDVLVCYTIHDSRKQVIVVGHYFERFREEARTDEEPASLWGPRSGGICRSVSGAASRGARGCVPSHSPRW